jgi:putative transposase
MGAGRESITIWIDHIPAGDIKEIELIFDRKLMLSISYKDGISPQINNSTGCCAIEPGEIH